MAGNKLYEPSAASNVAGGISGMRSFMLVNRRKAYQKPDRQGGLASRVFMTVKKLDWINAVVALADARASDTRP